MTTVLAIETTGERGGASVLIDGKVESEVEVSAPRRAGAELMPCIDKACLDAAIARTGIDVIAVNCGPGSYTGLRIGLATAAAIGFAFDKPVVGVPCFEAMVLQYVSASGFDVKLKRELWPVLDARRDEVMTARFEYAGGRFARATSDKLVAPGKLHEEAALQAIVFGEASKYEFNKDHLFIDKAEFLLKPSSVALAAWLELAGKDLVTLARTPVQPRYFRRVLAKTVAERAQ
jgi:tRNA threonylcarbamoyladenosine biosynthesis protein TsaB